MSEIPQRVFRDAYAIGEIIVSDEEITQRITDLAQEIAGKYTEKRLLVVGLLKGAFRVVSDLTTQLQNLGLTDLEISFMTTKSYLDGVTAQQEPQIIQDMDINPLGRHVLIVDDIADTGKSLRLVQKLIEERAASSVESFVLLDKPSRREVTYSPTYVGFTIPNIWVQGRGMDSHERGRADSHIRRGPYNI